LLYVLFFFFQAEDGIRDLIVTGVQTCALPICRSRARGERLRAGDAASPVARRRTGALARDDRTAERALRVGADPLPGASAHDRTAAGARARVAEPDRHGPSRLPRVPRARVGGTLRAHGLRRRAGRDVRPRRAVLHAARYDRAPDHDRARNEHAARPGA